MDEYGEPKEMNLGPKVAIGAALLLVVFLVFRFCTSKSHAVSPRVTSTPRPTATCITEFCIKSYDHVLTPEPTVTLRPTARPTATDIPVKPEGEGWILITYLQGSEFKIYAQDTDQENPCVFYDLAFCQGHTVRVWLTQGGNWWVNIKMEGGDKTSQKLQKGMNTVFIPTDAEFVSIGSIPYNCMP